MARTPREILDEPPHLAAENVRLSERIVPSGKQADLWIRLYEKQLERINQSRSACGPLDGSNSKTAGAQPPQITRVDPVARLRDYLIVPAQ
jgi:hypothetical protein